MQNRVVRVGAIGLLGLPAAWLWACGGGFSEAVVVGSSGSDASVTVDASEDGVVVVTSPPGSDGGVATDATGGSAADAMGSPGAPGMPDGAPPVPAGCPNGFVSCGGMCVPVDKNCGSCGHDCTALAHVTAGGGSCNSSGQCSFPPTACVAGWGDCDGIADDGCETSLEQVAHCGSCTNACPASAPQCQVTGSTAMCVTGCSGMTPTLCGSTCVNTTTDPQNCGGCGKTCSGAQSACTNGACACPTGTTLCGTSCVVSTPVSSAAFVSPSGGAAGTTCGASNAPCQTIAAALQAAASNNWTTVYLDKGTYTEQVALPSGITIQGGWSYGGSGNWSRVCTNGSIPIDSSILAAPSGAAATVTVAQSATGVATLDTLTVQNEPSVSSLPPGQSLYGVAVNSASLTLSNVSVQVGAAAGGYSGSPGGDGMGSVQCSSAGDSAQGALGPAGSPGPSGSYASGGFQPGGVAGAGGTGNAGDNGGAGGAAKPVHHCSSCYTPACDGGPGCVNGHNCSTGISITPSFGTDGTAGCGGQGGQGGTGGTGGGSSIAVFAWGSGAQVTLMSTSLLAGNGGNGGNGGGGGMGAAGVPGVAGTGGCEDRACVAGYPEDIDYFSLGGTPGAPGGQGGTGGSGGGGAGGDSYCYYAGGGAVVTPSTGFQCASGMGGAGGNQGSSGQAPSGAQGTHN